jgi:hypothetical protein
MMKTAAGLSGRRWARSVRTPDQKKSTVASRCNSSVLGSAAVPQGPRRRQCLAVASFARTWLTRHAQERTQRFARMSRRDDLYGDFIEEASRLFADALTLEFDQPSKFVRLHALVEKLRLFASAKARQPLKLPDVWPPFKGGRRWM